jgi:site-specific DNA recombinase
MGGSSCTHIKTKRLIETAEMESAELMYEMYAEPETSYGDIPRYFTENEIQVQENAETGILGTSPA